MGPNCIFVLTGGFRGPQFPIWPLSGAASSAKQLVTTDNFCFGGKKKKKKRFYFQLNRDLITIFKSLRRENMWVEEELIDYYRIHLSL